MRFTATSINGAVVIELEKLEDRRGFFARSFCAEEFAAHELSSQVVQCNISFNRQRGTLRGLHFQRPPRAEVKLVRCTAGAIYDVIVDLRPSSPTFQRYFTIELSARNHATLYVPKGCAHGFQTLQDDTEVFYQMSEVFAANATAGVRWNDPAFGIAWPLDVTAISDRDGTWPDFHADVLLTRALGNVLDGWPNSRALPI